MIRISKELGVDTRFLASSIGMCRAGRARRRCRATDIVRELRYQAFAQAQEYTLQFTFASTYFPSYSCLSHHAESEGQCKLRYLAVEIDAKCVAQSLGRGR